MSRVLLLGVPRSGTTWAGRALGATDGTAYVNEPDGFREPLALQIMLKYGEHPYISPGEQAPDYERLWTSAFLGGLPSQTLRDKAARFIFERTPLDERREARSTGRVPIRLRIVQSLAQPFAPSPDARHVVVKSVQGCLSTNWILEHVDARVILIERNPFNVLSSWRDLGFVSEGREFDRVALLASQRWGVDRPPIGAPHLALQSFFYGVLSASLRESAMRHPEWIQTTHEYLCVESLERFALLAEQVGLEWGENASAFISDSDTDGTPFRTMRRSADQPERWRDRLSSEEVSTIRSVLETFPSGLLADIPE